jgi:hypothetical protein
MKTIPLIAVSVRRDAMTLIPVSVPQYEIAVLKAVHGADNVYVSEGEACSIELDPATEGERLEKKYGDLALVKAFGPGYEAAISQSISSIDTAKGKRPVAAPA